MWMVECERMRGLADQASRRTARAFYGRRRRSADAVFTASLCRRRVPAYPLDIPGPKIHGMDIVSVLLGVLMFAVLIALIYGIDRI